MKLETLQELQQAARDRLKVLEAIKPTCLTCSHFPDGRVCAKWQAPPPSDFLVTPAQCPDWEHDGIPF